jgi:hypothetical protein
VRGDREEKLSAWTECLASCVGEERFFLKSVMGTPDSVQCMSGAHRAAHSHSLVPHRTGLHSGEATHV